MEPALPAGSTDRSGYLNSLLPPFARHSATGELTASGSKRLPEDGSATEGGDAPVRPDD